MDTRDKIIAMPQAMPAQQPVPARGFALEDVLWAVGIWSAIISLSPVIVFYMLMVA